MRKRMPATLMGLWLVCGVAAADDPPAAPKFTKVILPDAVRFVSVDSPDRQVRSMLFDNFILSTDVGRPTEPDVRTKTFSYLMGVESDGDVCVHQTFMGFVARFGSSSTAMIVHAGGQTTVVNLKQAIADANANVVEREESLRQQAEQAAADAGFENEPPKGEFDDFYVRISTLVPKGQKLQTTIILLVDRTMGSEDPQAMLTIDSIDSEVLPERKPQ